MHEKIYSVGIDLGTSTTQMVISALTMRNMASAFSIPRIEIIDKEVLYRSDIMFTPLISEQTIDTEKIKEFLDVQYKKSGFCREDIQVGAVIITGETARKENAQIVLEAMSGYAGDFVVATAGPDLESIIAGKGAGAENFSKEHRCTVANLDIGGGTTNIAVFAGGELIGTTCYDIGGRHIKVDATTEEIIYISPKVKQIIQQENLPITIGTKATPALLQPIIDIFATNMAYAVGVGPMPKYADLLVTTKPLTERGNITHISFSGGVADCVSSNEKSTFAYGDIGVLLGNALATSTLTKGKTVIPATETIRATVVGAGSHTTEVSGSTVTYANETLPMKNIPVLKLTKADEAQPAEVLASIIKEKFKWYQTEEVVALGMTGKKNPAFTEILSWAKGITEGLEGVQSQAIVLLQEDNGKSLGQSLFSMLPDKTPIVCLDGLTVENGDYVDIGLPVAGGSVLPVIIKTLVFDK